MKRARPHTGDIVEQFILVPEHLCGPHDGCFRERAFDALLALSFGLVELGLRIVSGVQMGEVHKALYTRLRSYFGYTLSARDLDRSVIEVPYNRSVGQYMACASLEPLLGLVFTPDEIVNDVRVSQALRNLRFVPNVPFLACNEHASKETMI